MNLIDTVRSVLKHKDQNIWSVPPKVPVYDAIKLMSDKHIGALLVISDGKLVGIISERDYARKVILRRGPPPEVPCHHIESAALPLNI